MNLSWNPLEIYYSEKQHVFAQIVIFYLFPICCNNWNVYRTFHTAHKKALNICFDFSHFSQFPEMFFVLLLRSSFHFEIRLEFIAIQNHNIFVFASFLMLFGNNTFNRSFRENDDSSLYKTMHHRSEINEQRNMKTQLFYYGNESEEKRKASENRCCNKKKSQSLLHNIMHNQNTGNEMVPGLLPGAILCINTTIHV